MLPEVLKQNDTAAALEAWDSSAILGGSFDLGEAMLWVDPSRIVDICRQLKEEHRFTRLSGVTVIDRHPMEPRFEVLYLLHSIERNERLKLKAALGGASPEIESVCGVWRGADWFEREAFDLFGVRFLNHPDLRRIMMPDNWEGHPLRRDFPTHGHKYSYQNE
ncbi:MAG: NADH-quinone oxidoreductase subunit C [Bryobacteraceae bacterium]|nr:NADH-quinone oxidoreductase subunit C [Bryobacteraceae bacterium]